MGDRRQRRVVIWLAILALVATPLVIYFQDEKAVQGWFRANGQLTGDEAVFGVSIGMPLTEAVIRLQEHEWEFVQEKDWKGVGPYPVTSCNRRPVPEGTSVLLFYAYRYNGIICLLYENNSVIGLSWHYDGFVI